MTTPDRLATLALATFLLCGAAAPSATARGVPGRPVTEAGPPLISPETGAFNCGTYKGNQLAALYHHSKTVARQRAIASGRAVALPAVSYTYDDVWVVEDDGSLLFSGTNTFDTQTTTFRFTPNVAGGYDVTTVPHVLDVSFLTHENLGLGDDDFRVRALAFTFPFYGTAWGEIYIGSNGAVALGANPNPSGFFSPDDFFNLTPKMCPYYMDLDPSAGAGSPAVYFNTAGDSAVVTWSAINEYGSSLKNSFQLILRADGTIDFVMIGIQSISGGGSSRAVMGIRPAGSPPYEVISFSAGLPHAGGAGAGIYEDYMNLANPLVNETALGQRFYQEFPDSFFQYVYFTNFQQTMAGFANEWNLSNDVTGIGLGLFDNSALFGSAGVLESRCNMNQIAAWGSSDPAVRFRGTQSFLTIMGQEAGHRWGAFVRFRDGGGQISNLILGRSDAHWSYFADVDHSCLEGGNWEETSPGTYVCPDLVDLFCEVDEYLFGLRSAEEVSDFFFVSSPSNDTESERSQPPPPAFVSAFGTPVPVTIDDIISAEGLRTPLPPAEEKDLRQAFIILLQNGTTLTQAELDKIAGFRRAWESYFERACDGRLTCNTSLTQIFPVAAIDGHVTSSTSGLPVLNLRARSLQRGFDQHVPAGGRYAFRYMANASSGPEQAVTIIFTAPEFRPDTVTTSIPYGTETTIDVALVPVANAVLPRARASC
jgi:hypothetical protein